MDTFLNQRPPNLVFINIIVNHNLRRAHHYLKFKILVNVTLQFETKVKVYRKTNPFVYYYMQMMIRSIRKMLVLSCSSSFEEL